MTTAINKSLGFGNAKTEFDARAHALKSMDVEVYRALYSDPQLVTQQLSVASIYAAKSISERSSFDDLFKSDDDISVGLSSLSNGKPEASSYFLCTAIMLQYAVAAGTTDDNVKAARYGLISDIMRNGEIEILQNKRAIFEKQSMEVFHAADHYMPVGDTNAVAGTPVVYTLEGAGNVGLLVLDTPKWIEPERKLEVNLDFAGAAATNAAVRIIFLGAKNVRL